MVARILAAVFLVGALSPGASAVDFAGALKEARILASSPAGRAYEKKVLAAVSAPLSSALHTCTASAHGGVEPIDYVLVIAADGTVTDTLFNAQNPIANCVLFKSQLPKRLSPPPHAPWLVAVHLAK